MNFLNNKLKMLLGMVGIAVNFSAQAQTQPARSAVSFEAGNEQIKEKNLQVISQDELINAIQSNQLETLLLKKGILIQKNSADSSLCLESSDGE